MGKQNRLFPSGADIKCKIYKSEYNDLIINYRGFDIFQTIMSK